MKKFFIAAACFVLTISCSKQALLYEAIVPADVSDPNFKVSAFNVQKSGGQFSVTFTTSMQKNVVSVELMHGSNPNQLCKVSSLEARGSAQTYQITDNSPMGTPTYYVIKYTLRNGEWGCSEVYHSEL